jgi:protein LTV1
MSAFPINYSFNCDVPATYSNLENHPRLIRARDQKPVPMVLLDRKTGFPSVLAATRSLENKSTERRVSLKSSPGTERSDESDSESLTNGVYFD